MEILTFENLEAKTNEFFSKHYNEKEMHLPIPNWERWGMTDKRPYNEEPGCYAMVFEKEGQEVIEFKKSVFQENVKIYENRSFYIS